jgi:hypothetical protein
MVVSNASFKAENRRMTCDTERVAFEHYLAARTG